MAFWQLAYNAKWIDADKLRLAVKTEKNPFGEISPEEYEVITGQKF